MCGFAFWHLHSLLASPLTSEAFYSQHGTCQGLFDPLATEYVGDLAQQYIGDSTIARSCSLFTGSGRRPALIILAAPRPLPHLVCVWLVGPGVEVDTLLGLPPTKPLKLKRQSEVGARSH